jgi:hypothetical protein
LKQHYANYYGANNLLMEIIESNHWRNYGFFGDGSPSSRQLLVQAQFDMQNDATNFFLNSAK